ncbi:MAG: universal stress protein [Hyphomicrobiaceae bacterium]
MSYKTIVVYLQNSKRAGSLLELAVPLAKKHDAHVVGLFITPDIPLHPVVEIHLPEEIIVKQQQAIEKECEQVRVIFNQATQSITDKVEWRNPTCLHSAISDVIVDHALSSDLVIISQDDDDQMGLWPDFPADVALGSGRPVLVVPRDAHGGTFGDKVIIAWNASREAARATFDALPILDQAREVHVLAVLPEKDGKGSTFERGDELAASLARHDISAVVSTEPTDDLPPGEAVLAHAHDNDFDMIVMGCYGHSRWREAVFGGASRQIMDKMKIPVLMSH